MALAPLLPLLAALAAPVEAVAASAPARPLAAPVADELEDARALVAAALEAGNAKGLGEVLAAHVGALAARDEAVADARRLERELENRRRVLRGLELRLAQDTSLEDVVERTQREVELLQVLLPHLAAGSLRSHLAEGRHTVQPDRFVSQRGEGD